jgi:hypothetical protein
VKSLRSALIFIGVAGVIFGLLMLVVIFTSDREKTAVIDSILTLVPAWSFIGTGLFAWWRRPSNRTGFLMVIVGFAWLLVPLSLSDLPALFAVAMFTSNLAWVLFALLLLSFPAGRLEEPWHRWLMAAFFVDACLLTGITGMLSGPDLATFECSECPTNPIPVWDRPDLAEAIDIISQLGGLILLVVLVTVLVRRYRSLGGANKSAIKPVLGMGAVTALSIGVLVGTQAVEMNDAVTQSVFVVTVVLISLVPFAFLIGLLRSRFSAAGAVSELIATIGETSAQELDIRDALAEALGDDTLEFFYWLPDRRQYVDS